MADFYVTADGGSYSEIEPVANAIKAEGFTVQTGARGPDAEALRNNGTVKPPTKLVFICNGGLAGATYGSFALDYSDGMCFTIFAFDNYRTHFSTTTEDALRNEPLVKEHDGYFATTAIMNDIKGHTTCSYQQKYPQVFAFVTSEKSAEDLGKKIAHGNYTCGSGGSSNNKGNEEEEEEEEWDDSDNFTPHKGKIMEIKPYKEISSISFDKSYDSPTGTGNVEILYNAKDYRFLYKGVAMKLKLRRTCDEQWSATGLEEPDYEEYEKFFKEHIPTDELLKELGLPNYRKQSVRKELIAKNSASLLGTSSGNSSLSDSSSSGSDSGSSSNSNSSSGNSSRSSSNNRNSSSSNKSKSKTKRHLSNEYISSISEQHASQLAKRTNEFDKETIKKLIKRASGLKGKMLDL